MHGSFPSFVFGYHGCDKAVGLDVLNGNKELIPSTNNWDWLGAGIYFWEHDASQAYEIRS